MMHRPGHPVPDDKFKLSQKSKTRLLACHPDMVAVVTEAIRITEVDFGLTCGLRQPEEQVSLYAQGKTQTLKSRHLPCLPLLGKRNQVINGSYLSGAVDVVAYVDGKLTWAPEPYALIKDAFFKAVENRNKKRKPEDKIEIRWGGDWDRDGDTTDQTFNDLVHFELYGPRYKYTWDHLDFPEE